MSNNFKWHGDQVYDATETACKEAITEGLAQVFPITQTKCPVDRGSLKKTGRILKVRKYKGNLSGRIRYGGARAPYAFFVEIKNSSYLRIPLKTSERQIVENYRGKLK